jgi:hypothetical protein
VGRWLLFFVATVWRLFLATADNEKCRPLAFWVKAPQTCRHTRRTRTSAKDFVVAPTSRPLFSTRRSRLLFLGAPDSIAV